MFPGILPESQDQILVLTVPMCRVCSAAAGFWDQGSGIRDQGPGVRVQFSGFSFDGAGCRDPRSSFGAQFAGCRVQGSGFMAQDITREREKEGRDGCQTLKPDP